MTEIHTGTSGTDARTDVGTKTDVPAPVSPEPDRHGWLPPDPEPSDPESPEAVSPDVESPDPVSDDPVSDDPVSDDPVSDDPEPAERQQPTPAESAPAELGLDETGTELDVRPAIEAILMVADEPISELTLASVLDRPQPVITRTLHDLARAYTEDRRGFDLREVGGGWRYYTRPDYAEVVERFVLDGQQARLTQAALETLAVVAYRQPVSRTRVSAIRGVNCDGVMRTLLSRGLVEEAGTDGESQATLYRTTSYFLERLGLQSLDELPDLAPYLPEVDQLDQADNERETLATTPPPEAAVEAAPEAAVEPEPELPLTEPEPEPEPEAGPEAAPELEAEPELHADGDPAEPVPEGAVSEGAVSEGMADPETDRD